ncbi:hypothetical protein U9M48_025273 [Paspalum notatum var. saurae]|uniref:Glycosyltransferase n=1 Tax=Paspalum notatum var. saurae TaxID=547442 RepID=A0AAQ3TQ29_PASNO
MAPTVEPASATQLPPPPPPPHFIIVPLIAQGHTIPMVDFARLLADRGTRASLVVTPLNAARLRGVAEHAARTKLPLEIVELPFPTDVDGLPPGIENVDQVTDDAHFAPLFAALQKLAGPLEAYLRALAPRPSCIVSDWCNPWTAGVARSLGIPRLFFHGPSCFYSLCDLNAVDHGLHDRISAADDEQEKFVVPGVPVRVEVTRATAPGFLKEVGGAPERVRGGHAHGRRRGGEHVRGARGPVRGVLRGGAGETRVGARAVLPLQPGRRRRHCVAREQAGRPAERGGHRLARHDGRGLVVRGWAPQLAVLSHRAVRGFVTHCGWNSLLESVAHGVPVVTWPHFADQFLNERLAVDVLGVGVPVGVTAPVTIFDDENVPVTRRDIVRAVSALMDDGEEAEERRRAREYGEKARRAMEKGGSSYENLTQLIECFRQGRGKQRLD